MTDIITILLAAAVAVLALLCCMLFYAIGRKDHRLKMLTDENRRLEREIHRLKDVKEDMEFQLIENGELIQQLNSKLRDNSAPSE